MNFSFDKEAPVYKQLQKVEVLGQMMKKGLRIHPLLNCAPQEHIWALG